MPLQYLKNVFGKSYGAYILLLTLSVIFIDERLINEQYSRYLGWKYSFDGPGSIPSGIMYFQSRIYLNSKDVEALANLGAYYLLQKEYAKAIDCLGKAVILQPEFRPFRNDLSMLYSLVGKPEKAKRILESQALPR